MEISKELLEKAKGVKSAAELLDLAKANGVDLDEAGAAAYFAKLGSADSKLSDEELDNAAAGSGFINMPPVPEC